MASEAAAMAALASVKRTYSMFELDEAKPVPADPASQRIRIASKVLSEYESVKDLPAEIKPAAAPAAEGAAAGDASSAVDQVVTDIKTQEDEKKRTSTSDQIVEYNAAGALVPVQQANLSLIPAHRQPKKVQKPQWHAPWKLKTVISGHLGWVRALAFEPGNEWFVSGAADRTIKVWDTATGQLKLTLTGHINCVRGLAISNRHPYMFSAAEDKTVKCWDLEYNKVIRSYHGHLSGVYALAVHPTLDVLMSGGRDSVCRVWDIRSKQQVHCLGGHSNTVCAIGTQATDPQVITGGMDGQVKLWDLAAGKSMATLTNHKKAVRGLKIHPRELTFVSAAADNVKKWHAGSGKFMRNLTGHNTILHCCDINQDNVLVTGGDDGSMHFWDYKTGYNFQRLKTTVQPGSLDSEAGIMVSQFDKTGSRLITGEADKTIKIWWEDEEADEESHPIDMKSWIKECNSMKRF
jgi:pleiotropic regulator 1